jgi:hypothetical protein
MLRSLAFVALLVAFVAWTISATPHLPGVDRAVGYCSIVYIGGALLLCFGDFQYGLFPPKSLRPIFIIGGGALMILAVALVYSLQREVS